MKKIGIISFTEAGAQLSGRMKQALEQLYDPSASAGADLQIALYTTKTELAQGGSGRLPNLTAVTGGLKSWCAEQFARADALIFIGAAGIAVRTIAPFVADKTKDPAILVADEKGRHLISLLSGHLGGGNALAEALAAEIGADPVITTASDVNGRLAIDVWAQKNGLLIKDLKAAKKVAAEIVAGHAVPFFCEGEILGSLPPELVRFVSQSHIPKAEISVWVSPHLPDPDRKVLHLIPPCIVLGIGCKKQKDYETIRRRLLEVCEELQISPKAIGKMVSIDLKAEEPGLLALSRELDIPFRTASAAELETMPGEYTASSFVSGVTGVDNVCERSAVFGLPESERNEAKFLCRKKAAEGVTIAMTIRKWRVSFE